MTRSRSRSSHSHIVKTLQPDCSSAAALFRSRLRFAASFGFQKPTFDLGSRAFGHRRIGVPMPEATVHEDHGAAPGQHEIGRAGQIPAMQPEAVTHPVHDGPDDAFRLHVARPHPRHAPGPLDRAQVVGHDPVRSTIPPTTRRTSPPPVLRGRMPWGRPEVVEAMSRARIPARRHVLEVEDPPPSAHPAWPAQVLHSRRWSPRAGGAASEGLQRNRRKRRLRARSHGSRSRGGKAVGLAVENLDRILNGFHLSALEVRLAALSTDPGPARGPAAVATRAGPRGRVRSQASSRPGSGYSSWESPADSRVLSVL